MGSMPPRDMQQWSEYMTADGKSTLAQERRANGRDKPWTNLKYFGVGNETWGCGGNMTAEHAANEHRRYATFVQRRSEGGPRSEERRVGKEFVSTCRSRVSPDH